MRTHVQADAVPDGHAAGHGRSGGHRRTRRRSRWVLWSGAVLLAAALAAAGLFVAGMTGTKGGPAPRTTVAALPYWSFSNGTDTVLGNRQDFTEVSPWIYGLSGSGQVVVQEPSRQPQVTADISRLRAAGLRILPTIANVTGGNWAYQPAALILHNPGEMSRSVAAITTLVTQQDYAGVDIDFEGLHAADRQAFSTFITDLAAAMHAHGKMLSVAVFAKTTDAGYGGQNVAQDYAAIGRAADQVRLMAYDYHWSTSPPGPIAPVGWIRDVMAYAKTQIPLSKIILGIPVYGYDWVGDKGSDLTWQQAVKLATVHRAEIHYDRASQSPWFSYTDSSGRAHQVWFEDPQSSAAKFAVANDESVGGVFLWMYGDEAPGTWSLLHQHLPVAGQSAAGQTGRS
ncbi:MAG: glycosyl hydrolase family 18 protein [Streptosporangiaceae bacterium]